MIDLFSDSAVLWLLCNLRPELWCQGTFSGTFQECDTSPLCAQSSVGGAVLSHVCLAAHRSTFGRTILVKFKASDPRAW
jgi:hypothetical protein